MGKITLGQADKKQSIFLWDILDFINRIKPGTKVAKQRKPDTFESVNTLYQGI